MDVARERKYSYLDTSGRPVVVLRKKNVVLEHHQPVIIEYSFSTMSLVRPWPIHKQSRSTSLSQGLFELSDFRSCMSHCCWWPSSRWPSRSLSPTITATLSSQREQSGRAAKPRSVPPSSFRRSQPSCLVRPAPAGAQRVLRGWPVWLSARVLSADREKEVKASSTASKQDITALLQRLEHSEGKVTAPRCPHPWDGQGVSVC